MAITNTPNEVVHQAYKSDKRSWFALKHTNLSSYRPGFEHPDLVLPITGNTTVKLNMSRYIQSAPTVTPLFDSMRVNFRVFFAPQRLYTRGLYGNNFQEVDDVENIQLPTITWNVSDSTSGSVVILNDARCIRRGSLLDRLGYPCGTFGVQDDALTFYPSQSKYYLGLDDTFDGDETPLSAMSRYHGLLDAFPQWNLTPIVAYFDICNHYIANPYIDYIPFPNPTIWDVYEDNTESYVDYSSAEDSTNFWPRQILVDTVLGVRGVVPTATGTIKHPAYYFNSNVDPTGATSFGDLKFGPVSLCDILYFGGDATTYPVGSYFDGMSKVSCTGLFPANFGEHYQTMFYDADEIDNLTAIDLGDNIEGLRLGKSVWNRTLRTILKGRKYTDWVDVQFGCKLKMSDHPIFVGSDSMYISFQDVINTSAQGDIPLGKAAGAGARGGKDANPDRTIVFTAQEPGILMVLVDFVPDVSYDSVIPRWLDYKTMASYPMPAYSGRTFQDLMLSDIQPLLSVGDSLPNNVSIGKQPLYFDYMSSFNRCSGLFGTDLFNSYSFKRNIEVQYLSDSHAVEAIGSTYIPGGFFDYQFADVGQNGRQNIWMKTEYNIRLYQPLDKQVVSGRI